MELYEEMRPELEAFFRRYRERGSRFCRIPVRRDAADPLSALGTALYATEYEAAAKPGGARRFADREVIAGYERIAGELFSSGENLESHFTREIAPLPPPAP
jgi:hypothetical protein